MFEVTKHVFFKFIGPRDIVHRNCTAKGSEFIERYGKVVGESKEHCESGKCETTYFLTQESLAKIS